MPRIPFSGFPPAAVVVALARDEMIVRRIDRLILRGGGRAGV